MPSSRGSSQPRDPTWVSHIAGIFFTAEPPGKPEQLLAAAAAAAKSLQSCLTLCDPIDGSPLGSPVPGILQARTLEWVAISFSNAWKWKVKVKSLSHVRLLTTPWTAAHQSPPSMGFSRQEYWSGVPLPSLEQLLTLLQIQAVKTSKTETCFLYSRCSRSSRVGADKETPGKKMCGSGKEFRSLNWVTKNCPDPTHG